VEEGVKEGSQEVLAYSEAARLAMEEDKRVAMEMAVGAMAAHRYHRRKRSRALKAPR
jgi:hypothetical protein